MPVHDELGIRMKTYYERIPKTKLMRRCPVAIRLDGKAFHTFTRGFQRPFDEVLIKSMRETMKYLCENIQGCVLGYTQSDEITIILVDYKKLTSSAWFDYEVQKMCSIAASMATMAFNKAFSKTFEEWACTHTSHLDFSNPNNDIDEEKIKICKAYRKAQEKGAMFDARCFNIPKEEVTNLVYWRQLDAARNSVQMVGQAHFSHAELQNKSCNDIQEMLFTQKGINWNDLPTHQKRGSCCIKAWKNHQGWEPCYDDNLGKLGEILCETMRSEWVIDTEIPMFKGEDREYIDKLIYIGE